MHKKNKSKIVSAAGRYGKTDWIWQEEASSEQNFLVCNSVSFKMFEEEVGWPVGFTKKEEKGVNRALVLKTIVQESHIHARLQLEYQWCNVEK